MNCDQAREGLELQFGSDDYPAELVKHIDECASCRANEQELTRLIEGQGSHDDFALSEDELARAVESVESRIRPHRQTESISIKWSRPLISAAAAILLLGVSFGAYQLGRDHAESEFDVRYTPEYGSLASVLEADLDEEMDEGLVSILIDDYSAGDFFGAGEALLGDISEEELEYLVENLEAGELL